MEIRPDGYTSYIDRKKCEDCLFCTNNFRTAPKQEWKRECNVMEVPFEVNDDDICKQFVKFSI